MSSSAKLNIARKLFEIGAVKFGGFRLKLHQKNPNAPLSPFYIDLRVLQSYPQAIKQVANIFIEQTAKENLRPDLISGIPDTATAIAALIMAKTEIPMITLRQHKKNYGIASTIIGNYQKGQEVLLIDDLVTKADTKLEIITALEKAGLQVKDVLVLIDREQGGKQVLVKKRYNLHAVFGARELFKLYRNVKIISQDKYEEVIHYLDLSSS